MVEWILTFLLASGVLIEGVDHVRQKPDFCGEACAEMVLRHLGHDLDQDGVFDMSGVDPALGRGCTTPELKRALEAIGFDVGPVWYRVDADRAEAQMQARFDELVSDLECEVASVVCMHYDQRTDTTEHFRLVLGYDRDADRVIYHEPAVSDGAYRRMPRARFLRLWPLKYDPDRWTVIRLRMKPRRIAADKRKGLTDADFAQHVRALRADKLPEDFHLVIQPPFVVVGDEEKATVARRARNTVGWAVRKLKQAYFERDPDDIIDIWLFRNERSYRKHARQLFDDEPDTPFGYYSPEHRALVMNIATGGGTLVHEIVHPFVKANFPGCPAWFNEGLGSLYEQCGERKGKIVGFTNWRLAGLQRAIRKGHTVPFAKLLATSEYEFYNEDPGTHYGQARYLCYYLQQKGLLRKFYRRFYRNRKKDPTGVKTLTRLLEIEDLEAFQERWEKWVLKLHFP